MYCEVCGGVLFHEYEGGRGMDKSYCRKCNPKVARITSLNDPKLDITLDELYDDPSVLEVDEEKPRRSLGNQRYALDGLGNPILGAVGPAGQVGPPGQSYSSDSTNPDLDIVLDNKKSQILFGTAVTEDDLPENGAAVGQLTFVQEDETLHIWDGEEWTNMGDVARELRVMRTSARNRRAEAIAATRKKRAERGEKT